MAAVADGEAKAKVLAALQARKLAMGPPPEARTAGPQARTDGPQARTDGPQRKPAPVPDPPDDPLPDAATLPAVRVDLPAAGASAEQWRTAFQRQYYALLTEPEVVGAVRRILRAKDTKGAREMFGVIAAALAPREEAGKGGPVRIVFKSNIPRPPKDVTPPTKASA